MSRKKQDKCANPLFEKWLCEWKDEANARGSKTAYVYSQAIKSIRKYPLVLKSGKEAKMLEFFGDKICSMLDKKLEAHRKVTGETVNDTSSDNQLENIITADKPNKAKRKATSPFKTSPSKQLSPTKRTNTYLPKRRSGGYALLITLYKNFQMPDSRGFMSKSELLVQAQPFCDASFTLPEPGSYYTAWSTMANLIKKGLVRKEGHPPRYSLTDEGAELGDKIIKGESTWDKNNDISSQIDSSHPSTQSIQSEFSQSQNANHFILLPEQFEIILCVDNAEVLGSASERRAAIQAGLTNNGVNFDIRKLHVGDFVWIAKEKQTPTSGSSYSRELVLDYIIERKRKDDLAHSIMDGRFKEQKARLKSCGLTRPIYLVEEYGKKDNFSIPLSSLQQAVVNTQIVDGFTITNTKDLSESTTYLTQMTRQLQNYYSSKSLRSVNLESRQKSQTVDTDFVELLTFEEFNSSAVKNRPLTVEETFAKQLMKVHGMSVEKVKAILEIYSTPSSLYNAYLECTSQKEAVGLLSNIKWGKSGRNLGPAISQILHQLYTKEIFP
ncbi:Crossover junction endonuclease mus81 [Chamberlinius hualienensis]